MATKYTTKLEDSLWRIRAEIDMPSIDVYLGDYGGLVEHGGNLSHEGNCWVFPDALAIGQSRVLGNAVLEGRSAACQSAIVRENVIMTDDAIAAGSCVVHGSAVLSGNCTILDEAIVRGAAEVSGYAVVRSNAIIDGDAKLSGVTILGYGRRVVTGVFMTQPFEASILPPSVQVLGV